MPQSSVPALHIKGTRKKSLREGRRNYYTHKMGAGYKSRCSDAERWQQYVANEHRWASSGTNFSCPFRFISKESYSEEVIIVFLYFQTVYLNVYKKIER